MLNHLYIRGAALEKETRRVDLIGGPHRLEELRRADEALRSVEDRLSPLVHAVLVARVDARSKLTRF